ncbi:MAG: hypothetical protein JSV10_10490 [Candidatus Zixiibacteriota bacterium]|nr:MAG: hypothetical protein JSV10_10490 [candidate division Zixibacteria bacterium]
MDSRYAFSDSILTPRNGILSHPGFFEESSSSTRLSLLRHPGSYSGYALATRAQAPFTYQPRPRRVNYKRASVLCTANAATLFFGFKGAMAAWGESKGAFHFKDDWKGDKLKQTDELSHFMWGYKMTQFLFGAYRWSGFSDQASHAISVFQTAFVLTMVEYPIDAHNPKQGLGVSDLVFDYAGIGLAYVKRRFERLEDFDFKVSWKSNILLSNRPMFPQTFEEFDNFIYWFTYRTRLFLPQKIVCLGLGYSAVRRGEVAKRQVFAGIGLSLPDLAALFGKKFKARAGFLEVFYPNLRIEL